MHLAVSTMQLRRDMSSEHHFRLRELTACAVAQTAAIQTSLPDNIFQGSAHH